ncbi:hypothetical protein GA0115234_100915, partial [Streptomyces sp. DvalAA-43]
PRRPTIGCIDFRRPSSNRPRRYNRPFARWSARLSEANTSPANFSNRPRHKASSSALIPAGNHDRPFPASPTASACRHPGYERLLHLDGQGERLCSLISGLLLIRNTLSSDQGYESSPPAGNYIIPFQFHGRAPSRPRKQSTRCWAWSAHSGLPLACWAAYVAMRSSRMPARMGYPPHSVTSYPYAAQNSSYSADVAAPVVRARTAVETRSHSGGPKEKRSRSISSGPSALWIRLPGQASPCTTQSARPDGRSAHALFKSA